jgi:hypothetical protein
MQVARRLRAMGENLLQSLPESPCRPAPAAGAAGSRTGAPLRLPGGLGACADRRCAGLGRCFGDDGMIAFPCLPLASWEARCQGSTLFVSAVSRLGRRRIELVSDEPHEGGAPPAATMKLRNVILVPRLREQVRTRQERRDDAFASAHIVLDSRHATEVGHGICA